MRKFINLLIFLGKAVVATANSAELLIPAWDDYKAKNAALDAEKALREATEEKPVENQAPVAQPVMSAKPVIS